MAAHILGTIVAYTVYIKLSSLGDGYAPEDFQGFNGTSQDFVSTIMVHGIYHYVGAFLPGFLAPMVLGLIVAILIWYTFRDHPYGCRILAVFLQSQGMTPLDR